MVFSKNRDNAIATYQNNGSRNRRFHDFRAAQHYDASLDESRILLQQSIVFVLCEHSAFVLDVKMVTWHRCFSTTIEILESPSLSVAHCDKKFFLVISFPSKIIVSMTWELMDVKWRKIVHFKNFRDTWLWWRHLLLVTSSGHVTILNVKTENVLFEMKVRHHHWDISSGQLLTTNGKPIRCSKFCTSRLIIASFFSSTRCVYLHSREKLNHFGTETTSWISRTQYRSNYSKHCRRKDNKKMHDIDCFCKRQGYYFLLHRIIH